ILPALAALTAAVSWTAPAERQTTDHQSDQFQIRTPPKSCVSGADLIWRMTVAKFANGEWVQKKDKKRAGTKAFSRVLIF
ncbi:MAG: hypothetical protein ACLQVW_16645, partial [Limisphaerales bacterium]